MHEAGDKVLVSSARLNFGEEVGVVCFAFRPGDFEDFATGAVSYPVVAHIVGLGFA